MNPIGKRISMLYRHSQIYINDRLKKYNIGSGQYMFLLNLYENSGINQDHLSELLMIDKATTARAIKKLEKEGYVLRKVNSQDKRSYEIYVTDKGNALKENITEVLVSWRNILRKNFSDTDADLLLTLIDKMTNNTIEYFDENKDLIQTEGLDNK